MTETNDQAVKTNVEDTGSGEADSGTVTSQQTVELDETPQAPEPEPMPEPAPEPAPAPDPEPEPESSCSDDSDYDSGGDDGGGCDD
ncbi:hypothetical protein HOA55_02795 [archaeon]|nr:hypothetical protein [archaeon]MBT6820257.1 hypothetical protein [archaeon]MBT7025461.1 hypothetical protein [archaeon]MBT7239311.1 hypothetical protein [archaeon]